MALSNMMKHYLSVKEKYPDCIIFYRLGDFYEMFFEDAVEASKVLDLTLTGRDCGLENRAPMCGVPFHASENYIAKLVENGYKVAICEQLTEPKPGTLVQRDVVRVVTPGIVMDESMLDKERNNYIAALNVEFKAETSASLAFCDVSTGEFVVEEIKGEESVVLTSLDGILTRISPSELVCEESCLEKLNGLTSIKAKTIGYVGTYNKESFDISALKTSLNEQFENVDLNKNELFIAGVLLEYLKSTQKRSLQHINKISNKNEKMVMGLDPTTIRNLELIETIRDHKKKGSLLSVIDNTQTCMGGRMIRNWLTAPSLSETEINSRLDSIEDLISNIIAREDLKRNLSKVSDIERIAGRIAYGNFNPKDALALKTTAKQLPEIKELLKNYKAKKLKGFFEDFDSLDDVFELLEATISEDAPTLLRDGEVIKEGFDAQLDEYRNAKKLATVWLSELEAKERELTGIKNLRIAYNKVFGYFIEVNKSQTGNVPYRYQRKQTVANNERYITEDLKIIEEKVESAKENATKLEIEIFNKVRNFLLENIKRIQKVSKTIAELDCLLSGAILAIKNSYCKPKINNRLEHIKIVGGRHPVVEHINKTENFVPNDTFLNSTTDKSMIITGPNMAGKSTYMRQVALIVLLAHVGYYVPATSAEIAITDRIFTRIGASDDVAFGQSTFMVEMVEVANILNNATEKSLALLDEIGRGTSTFDGLSIAWAVMEHISENLKMKTLFSTHYHELTELEGVLEGVKNYRITVKEFNDEVIFLRKIVRGGANKSFGVAVAKLAGLPKSVIERAKIISKNLETSEIKRQITETNLSSNSNYEENANSNRNIVGILKDIDINKVTPLTAFEILADLVEKAK